MRCIVVLPSALPVSTDKGVLEKERYSLVIACTQLPALDDMHELPVVQVPLRELESGLDAVRLAPRGWWCRSLSHCSPRGRCARLRRILSSIMQSARSDIVPSPPRRIHHALLQDPRIQAPPAGHVARRKPFGRPFRDDPPFQDEPLRMQLTRLRVDPPVDNIDR